MTAIYAEHCDCDLIPLGLAHPSMIVLRFKSETEACRALLEHFACYFDPSAPTDYYCEDRRYWMIHGPGGHLLGVRGHLERGELIA